jgi:hypothetical protein
LALKTNTVPVNEQKRLRPTEKFALAFFQLDRLACRHGERNNHSAKQPSTYWPGALITSGMRLAVTKQSFEEQPENVTPNPSAFLHIPIHSSFIWHVFRSKARYNVPRMLRFQSVSITQLLDSD